MEKTPVEVVGTYLTTEEVASILRCNAHTVRRMTRSGELPAFRASKRGSSKLLYRIEDVQKLLQPAKAA